MKQRTRIRRRKDHLYPWLIYTDRQRKVFAGWQTAQVKLSDALRKFYDKVKPTL